MQHGAGLGSIFQGLFRTAIPIIKSVGRKILPRIARAGMRTLSDVIVNKQSPKEAIMNRAAQEMEAALNNDNGIKGAPRRRPRGKAANRPQKRRKITRENF